MNLLEVVNPTCSGWLLMLSRKVLWMRIIETLAISLAIATVIGCMLFSTLMLELPPTGFATRWTGGCNGWTKPIALVHAIADFITWGDYVIIAVAIATLHPVMNRVRSAPLTVALITTVFVTCGGTHLADAYTTFYSSYFWSGIFKAFAAIVGFAGAIFIAHDLCLANALVRKDRERLQKFNSE